ncbi:Insulin receptor-related [Schistosoma japonicum]|uniref:Insulin receptor-related n=1 Tax=Schistosoma japonicum TaxID=6182 RepID=A0A4Z2D591_SCHJA|nr:Insulin receptor-related [Schistosoma japonicum]
MSKNTLASGDPSPSNPAVYNTTSDGTHGYPVSSGIRGVLSATDVPLQNLGRRRHKTADSSTTACRYHGIRRGTSSSSCGHTFRSSDHSSVAKIDIESIFLTFRRNIGL